MMDSKILREAALSYLAVYDEEVRDRMEELGMISEEDAYYEAREPGVKPYRSNPTQAEVRADAAAARKSQVAKSKGQSGYGDEEKFKSDWKLRVTPGSTLKTKSGEAETVSQRMNREKPYAKRMTGKLAREYGSRAAERVTRVRVGKGEPRAVKLPEEFDIYDVVLSHLLDEGYAETLESAEAIMVNMSEEWIDAILEG